MTNVPKKVLKTVVITTCNDFDKYFTSDLRLAETVMRRLKGATIETVQVVKINPASLAVPRLALNQDGQFVFDHAWFEREITKRYAGNANIVCFHFSRKERELWGLEENINGLYWNDKNAFMECYVVADPEQKSPHNRTQNIYNEWTSPQGSYRAVLYSRISQFLRVFLHETGHAAVHFTSRKEELTQKYGYDPVHYFDYVEKDVSAIFSIVSFERYSIMEFIISLQKQLIDMLKNTPPVVTPKSRLEEWAKAIEKFEDYVPPGGYFRNGKLSVEGSVSWRNKNPGNLRWSIYEQGNRNNFSYFATYKEGWEALLHQLRIAADGRSSVYRPNMTLLEFFKVYAPSEDNNFPETYAQFVAKELKVPVTTLIKNLI